MISEVRVRIPATTANLGPGFDCLGLALTLYNNVRLVATAGGRTITVSGEGEESIPRNGRNLVIRAAEMLFERAGQRPAGYALHQKNGIPVGSGLGSSAAAVIGGLLAANALLGGVFAHERLLALATELEGHPDNVAPALYGGLILVARAGEELIVEPIAIPGQRVVVVLPGYSLPTARARAALPVMVAREDAVFNAGRLGLLLRALMAGDSRRLAVAMQDRLHQPYRLPLVPGLEHAMAAAYKAGAAGVALSGAGPSLIALANEGHEAIAQAAGAAFTAAGLRWRHWLLEIDRQGATVAIGPEER
jgi:homoserine kinase